MGGGRKQAVGTLLHSSVRWWPPRVAIVLVKSAGQVWVCFQGESYSTASWYERNCGIKDTHLEVGGLAEKQKRSRIGGQHWGQTGFSLNQTRKKLLDPSQEGEKLSNVLSCLDEQRDLFGVLWKVIGLALMIGVWAQGLSSAGHSWNPRVMKTEADWRNASASHLYISQKSLKHTELQAVHLVLIIWDVKF